MKTMKSLTFLVIGVMFIGAFVQAGLAPTHLPPSSYYQGRYSFLPEDTVNGAHWLGFRCVKEIPA